MESTESSRRARKAFAREHVTTASPRRAPGPARHRAWAPLRVWLVALLTVLGPPLLASCKRDERALAPKSQTWAELRVVRRDVTVTPPDEPARAPYPRERLVDGETVKVEPGGLAWIRRDGGALLLVRGPATLRVRPDTFELVEGRVFVDTPAGLSTELFTPNGPVFLSDVRASLEVKAGATEAYVLRGEVRALAGVRARAGERLSLSGAPAKDGPGDVKGTTAPAVAWEDWTGGLATTERQAEPAPFGVGTVGARRPGELGVPRFPLAIQKLDVRVRVEGDLAITEVDERFFNPSSETVEGIYRFRAPEGAVLSRFGVDREGVVMWGRVKEKQLAAAQYQSHVYAGSTEDPALLEWDAPGVYRARLYPIGPGETRRVVVRYVEWLARTGKKGERRHYVYPMAAEGSEGSLPHVEELRVEVDLAKAGAKAVRSGMAGTRVEDRIVVRAHDFVPRADFSLELFDDGVSAQRAFIAPHMPDLDVLPPDDRADAAKRAKGEADYFLVPLRATEETQAPRGLDLVVVVDTSAGTDAASLALARSATGALLAHLGGDDRVAVFTGDTALAPVGADALGKLDEGRARAILSALASAERSGATDLGAVLVNAAGKLDPARRGAVVYVGDGVSTVGERTLPELRDKLGKLPRPVRIFSLGVGERADMGVLAGLSRGSFAERVSDAHGAARAVVRLLEAAERPVFLDATIDLGPTVERVYPRRLGALVGDETVMVVGRLKGAPPTSIKLGTAAGPRSIALVTNRLDDAGDARRRWAEGRLGELLDEGAGHAALVDLGVRQGIITPVTSLYVPTASEMTSAERRELEQKKRELERLQKQVAEKSDEVASAKDESKKRELKAKLDDAREEAEAERDNNKEGGTGTRAKGEEGRMRGPAPQATAFAAAAEPAAPSPMPVAASESSPKPMARPSPARAAGPGSGAGRGCAPGDPLCSNDDAPAPTPSATAAPPSSPPVSTLAPNDPMGAPDPQAGGGAGFLGDAEKAKRPDGDDKSGEVLGGDRTVDGKPADGVKGGLLGNAATGASAPGSPVSIVVRVGDAPAIRIRCSDASELPLAERIPLWRERMGRAGSPEGVASVYRSALATCEAPTFRERSVLLSIALDVLPSVAKRVRLWRIMQRDHGAADAIYRGILGRIRTAAEVRELHQSLGLRFLDPAMLDKTLAEAKGPADRATRLRELLRAWPDDLPLHVRLLHALEDAGDDGAALELAKKLRARADADASLRTAVGELYLRLAERAKAPQEKAARTADAKRAFGEIVEFSPDDPVARRRLGDLLRAHGWFDEAERQYQTLKRLVPDDPGVSLLLASCSNGVGKLEEAIQWTEKAATAGSPDVDTSPARTATALAATFLAWGKADARKAGKSDEVERIGKRQARLPATKEASGGPGAIRVTLTWSHPDLHPTLWGNALGAVMPASEGDPLLGVAQVVLPARPDALVEVRLEPDEVERAARLGAVAVLTVIVREGKEGERIERAEVRWKRDKEAGKGGPNVVRVEGLGGALRVTEVVVAPPEPKGQTAPKPEEKRP
jgi:tetratricopeptide (TPR) repeat protein